MAGTEQLVELFRTRSTDKLHGYQQNYIFPRGVLITIAEATIDGVKGHQLLASGPHDRIEYAWRAELADSPKDVHSGFDVLTVFAPLSFDLNAVTEGIAYTIMSAAPRR